MYDAQLKLVKCVGLTEPGQPQQDATHPTPYTMGPKTQTPNAVQLPAESVVKA